MAKKYTSEEFWKLYEQLPQELKNALFAEETGNNIYEICKKNGVAEKLGEIVDCVGQVLVGVLPPEEFRETLEKELTLGKDIAKKVTQEINRFIFYPVKPCLEELYGIAIAPPAGAVKVSPAAKEKSAAAISEEKPAVPAKEEESSLPGETDRYRESTE